MPYTVLVTGGGGYIASHTIIELLQGGHEVIAVDNFVNAVRGNDAMPESLQRVQKITGKKITFYTADLTEKDALKPIFQKVFFMLFIVYLKFYCTFKCSIII